MSGKRARYVWGAMVVVALLIAAGSLYLFGPERADTHSGGPTSSGNTSARQAGAHVREQRR